MGKHKKPPAKREKAPNQKEQRRYQQILRRKQRKLQRKQELENTPRKRPMKYPLGFGIALMLGLLGSMGVALADRMHIAFDGEYAMMILMAFIILPFILMPLLVKLLGQKWNDRNRAYNIIDRIDGVCGCIALTVIALVQIAGCIRKLTGRITAPHELGCISLLKLKLCK